MLQAELPGNYRVSVRRADLQRAKEALRAIRAESVDLDWNEVNTGDAIPENNFGAPQWARTARWFIIAIVAAALLVGAGYLIQMGLLSPSPPR